MTSLTQLLVRPEILKAHRATWFTWSQGVKMRYQSTMRGGNWGYDVTCSCGWESKTGGALRRYVEGMLLDHRTDEQAAEDTRQLPCPRCEAKPGTPCRRGAYELEYMHAERWKASMQAEEN